ncbi:hypothetical protein GGS24DRAFT_211849 [Hypoxylon argillaceum]|nr:hypothetical protein GGS24DRAFT_211849 [Hypoxylon argillaceum]
MVDVMRISTQGQYSPDAMERDMAEMTTRLTTTTIGSIQEELKKGLAKDEETKDGSLHVPPRRAFTTADYLLPTAPVSRAATPTASPRESMGPDSYFPLPALHLTPTRSPYLPPAPPPKPSALSTLHQRHPQLAATGAAQHRSYSVMDYEPVPFTHQPGTKLQLAHLPAELHYALFEFLDPIDSVCLALTSRHFYAVHWNLHGRVSLAARREGPNDMEWVWRNAGPFLLGGGHSNGSGSGSKQNSLAMLSPRGQVYCRKCRTARCELHKHIREWMGGSDVEYCVVTEKYGAPAPADAKGFCFRSSPRHPNRCGRHTRNRRAVRLV